MNFTSVIKELKKYEKHYSRAASQMLGRNGYECNRNAKKRDEFAAAIELLYDSSKPNQDKSISDEDMICSNCGAGIHPAFDVCLDCGNKRRNNQPD